LSGKARGRPASRRTSSTVDVRALRHSLQWNGGDGGTMATRLRQFEPHPTPFADFQEECPRGDPEEVGPQNTREKRIDDVLSNFMAPYIRDATKLQPFLNDAKRAIAGYVGVRETEYDRRKAKKLLKETLTSLETTRRKLQEIAGWPELSIYLKRVYRDAPRWPQNRNRIAAATERPEPSSASPEPPEAPTQPPAQPSLQPAAPPADAPPSQAPAAEQPASLEQPAPLQPSQPHPAPPSPPQPPHPQPPPPGEQVEQARQRTAVLDRSYSDFAPDQIAWCLSQLETVLGLAAEQVTFGPGDAQRDQIAQDFTDQLASAWHSATERLPTCSRPTLRLKNCSPFARLLETINQELLEERHRSPNDFFEYGAKSVKRLRPSRHRRRRS
jgi:hypothetical protein